ASMAWGAPLGAVRGGAARVNARSYLLSGGCITAGLIDLGLTFVRGRLFKLAERHWLAYLAPRKH
ncbi:amino acid ABC transporter permease, partial [Pseudomonas soli]|nr:amino acid ABC transporter permease [Pseudomonas soli]